MTALAALLVLFALCCFGGEVIRAFSIALIVGVTAGTYSSIYVAGRALLALGVSGRGPEAAPSHAAFAPGSAIRAGFGTRQAPPA